MKRTALALHHLVSTKFRGDRLQLIGFGRYAQTMDIGELTALPACGNRAPTCTTGCCWPAGSSASTRPCSRSCWCDRRRTHRAPGVRRRVLVQLAAGPGDHPRHGRRLDRLGRAGTQATFFRLGNDPGLERFVAGWLGGSTAAWWRPTRGTWVPPSSASTSVRHFRGRAYGDDDWAT